MRNLIQQLQQGAIAQDGYVSLEQGFLNPQSPEVSFPPGFQVWDDLAKKLSEHIRNNQFKEAVHDLPVLDAQHLDDKYLRRARVVLNSFAKAYCFHENLNGALLPTLPDQILIPWRQVCSRLGREQPDSPVLKVAR